jgi:hypothetical protein
VNRPSKFAGLAGALNQKRKGKEEADAPAKKLAKSKDKENYVQTTAYIAKQVHVDLQVALAEEQKEYSQLVEDLLVEWMKGRKRPDV